jgi:hypothetical protein
MCDTDSDCPFGTNIPDLVKTNLFPTFYGKSLKICCAVFRGCRQFSAQFCKSDLYTRKIVAMWRINPG